MLRSLTNIRRAGRDDIGGLLDLYRHLVPDDDPPASAEASAIFDRFLAYRGSGIFVALADATLVASCTLIVVPNLTRGGAPYGLIENVVTHADFRNCGLGKQVLEAATEAAWQEGCYKVMLLAGSKSPAVLDFYLGAGFEQSKTGFQKRRIPVRSEG